ncbi:MAG: hypothetical protein GAK44_00297 [Pseudomonas delhiensis]|nr:MAG: hypothetical protein GAK44_00297 [Pseudomonas delhiensis]
MNGVSEAQLVLRSETLRRERVVKGVHDEQPDLQQLSLWRLFWQRIRTRRQLLELDDAQLSDIGLSRADAVREGSRPFWRG